MFVTTRLITDCGDQRICVVIKLPARFCSVAGAQVASCVSVCAATA
jgi:hypothetical protein